MERLCRLLLPGSIWIIAPMQQRRPHHSEKLQSKVSTSQISFALCQAMVASMERGDWGSCHQASNTLMGQGTNHRAMGRATDRATDRAMGRAMGRETGRETGKSKSPRCHQNSQTNTGGVSPSHTKSGRSQSRARRKGSFRDFWLHLLSSRRLCSRSSAWYKRQSTASVWAPRMYMIV